MNEFKRIREEKVPPTELENAKRSIVGAFALSLAVDVPSGSARDFLGIFPHVAEIISIVLASVLSNA